MAALYSQQRSEYTIGIHSSHAVSTTVCCRRSNCSLNPSLIPLLPQSGSALRARHTSAVSCMTSGRRQAAPGVCWSEVSKIDWLFLGQFGLDCACLPPSSGPFMSAYPSFNAPSPGSLPTLDRAILPMALRQARFISLVTVLALQLALGIGRSDKLLFVVHLFWRNLAERESQVYTNLIAIGAIAVVWYGMEVSHWPPPAAAGLNWYWL